MNLIMVAKLTDVAKLAGVSPTTVSRVINKKGYLSEKTIQKVQEAMRELGYKPNNVARSLQGKSAKLVGLIFPNISNVFYAELIDKLEHQLFKHGYKTIICNSEHDSEKEREYIEMLEANQVDGIIAFDRNLSPEIPVVSSDNYAGGVLAAETLVKTRARNIIMITGNDNSNSPTGLRHAGFASVLPESMIINVSSDFSPIRKEMEIKQILTHHKPDAIFASDDLTAILIMKVARELDIQIPQDLKVIGYDGTQFIETYTPELTTIQQPLKDIAILMVDLLLQKIEGKKVATTGYFLPVSLHSGKSV